MQNKKETYMYSNNNNEKQEEDSGIEGFRSGACNVSAFDIFYLSWSETFFRFYMSFL